MNSRSISILRVILNTNRSRLFAGNANGQAHWRWTSTTSSSKGQAAITLQSMSEEPTKRQQHHLQTQQLDLTFNDSEKAFKSKSNLELLRGYLVFQLCSINFLVENQKKILDITRRVFGQRLFGMIMKSTFYGHFVAGENQQAIKPNVETMMKYGVKSILDYSAEEDLTSHKTLEISNSNDANSMVTSKRKMYHPNEIQCEKNAKIFYDCVEAVADVTNSTGLGALKFTSLLRPELLLKFSSLMSALEKMENLSGKRSLSWSMLKSMNEADWKAFVDSVPLGQSEKIEFSSNELNELCNMIQRIDEIVKHVHDKNVRIFVDAEQTYFQDAIRRLTMELMREYNKNNCVVLNTYQNYLTSAFDELSEDMKLAERENFCFGAKLVRGAYMEQERERARQMGYADPINVDYDATTRMYEKSLLHCLEQMKKLEKGKIAIMVASHNEDTVKFAVEKMAEYNIKPYDKTVCFGQLFGMCDYISFYLGSVGYSVYKYVPYGPVEEVLPYLSRRATENKGIFEKVKKEKRLLLTEIKRRIKSPLFG